MDVDYEVAEACQTAFDAYIAQRIPDLMSKHAGLIESIVAGYIKTRTANIIWSEVSKHIDSHVTSEVGNYLRVGAGRSIIDTKVLECISKDLEKHIESAVAYRLGKLIDKIQTATLGATP